MSRLIITGAGGFLGCNVVKGILAEKTFDEIIAVTIGAEQMKSIFAGAEGLEIYEAGAITAGSVKLVSDDLVLNCAYPRAMKGADVTAGLDYVESVFQAAEKAAVRGIVNISSQSVYDPHRDHPAAETDVPVLTNEYAIGKYCLEMLLRNVCRDIPFTNVRLASLIGPGFDARVPNKMVKFALEKGVITAQENNQRFGYLDVEDAVRGLIGLLKLSPEKWKQIYNLGGKETYTLVEIAECAADYAGQYTGNKVVVDKVQSDAVLNSSLNSDLLITDIGVYEKNSLGMSIEKIVVHAVNKAKQDG